MSVIDLAPFSLIQADSPVVISVPHDGALIPDDILVTMNSAVLNSSDRDYLIGELFDFNDLAYAKIQANYSRHVIDLNRPASGAALYQNQAETELCPTSTFDFKAIYLEGHEPGQTEIQRRIDLYWRPYHDRLSQMIQTAKQNHGYCLLIDAHSIDDRVPRFFEGQLPDINIGTFAGKSCAVKVEQTLVRELSKQVDFSFVENGRFKGGFITRNYGNPGNNIHAIQLEHAKGSYLNSQMKLSEKSAKLRHMWQQTIKELISCISN